MAETNGAAGTDRVAVVLSGAGARGAFQAGALAELLPWLDRRGERPMIWLGTSAGSINAVLWAALARRKAESAADEVLGLWRRMSEDNVYRPLAVSLPRTGLEYAAGAVLGRGTGTTSLLDTEPLRRTASEHLDTDAVAGNVRAGVVDAVGVVATRMPTDHDDAVAGAASGRSVLFLHEHRPHDYAGEPDRALDVVRGPVTRDHVLASSAIPVAFPPVQLSATAEAGWYLDGGVRLNTPLHPAVGLGATKVLVVSATSTTYAPLPPAPGAPEPDIADAAAQVLNAALADKTTEDLRALRRTNRLVHQAARANASLTAASGRAYRRLEVMAVSPPPGALGRAAAEVFARKTNGLGRVTEMDNWLLGRAIRGAGDGVGRRELLSYLFFDEDYFAAGIELGRAAARRAIGGGWES